MIEPQVISQIKDYLLTEQDIIAAYLFGSVVKNQNNQFSDIDLAILLDPKKKHYSFLDLRLGLSLELGSLLKREVDVIILNEAPCLLKYEIFRSGRCILERSPQVSRAFIAQSLSEYYDYAPALAFFHHTALKKVWEGSRGKE